jgi:hypothetical protein
MDKPPYLTLVDPVDPGEQEFLPLPYYPWDERPPHLAIDPDEAATAIHLGETLPGAALLLKVPLRRLVRLVKHSPRLTRILAETTDILVAEASAEYARALRAPDDRRREWAATKIMQSRAAAGHPLSPAPPNSTMSLTATQTDGSRRITFRWRTDADLPNDDVA